MNHFQPQSRSASFSESLLLDDTQEGVIITGVKDGTVAAKSGLQAGDEIVAATINLDHLNKNEVLSFLKVLEPYESNMKVLTKKDFSASAGLGSLGFGLKDPTESNLSLDASAEAPTVSLDGLKGKLNAAPGLGGEIGGPLINGDFPTLSLNKPSADAGASLTLPSGGLTGPDIKAGLDGTVKAPNVSVNTPSASLDIDKPDIKTGSLKYKPPKFTMPHFRLPQIETPKRSMDVSGDLKSPNLDLNGPKVDLDGPDLNLETPNVDIEAPSGKIKWPHHKWKGLKGNGPDCDLNAELPETDVSFSTPKMDGDLSGPDCDINLPKADIKGPNLDIQTPDLDIDSPSGKIHWPHLKWKKPKLHGPKGDLDFDTNLKTPDADLSAPNMKGEINAPDIDMNLPKADLEGPDLAMQTPDIDVEAPSGKINWPHLKWKKPKLHGPKADLDLDADLNTPDLNVSCPNIDGDIDFPNAQLNLPKADLRGPEVDIHAPDLDIDGPSGKINWPHLKWKKTKFHGPKADLDMNADLSTPDVDLSLPNADVDVEAPDIKAPSGKIKFPTLKKPKFLLSGPKVKAPDVDVDADVKAPDLSLSPQASLNGPKADVDIEAPSGKLKWPTLKKPKWSMSGPKVNGPDVDFDADVSAPDLDLSVPKINGELNTPDVDLNLPNAEVEGLKLDVDADSGKFKWFNFKKPKFGTLKVPKADFDADVDLNATDVNFTAPKINAGIEAPELPDMDLNGSNLDIDPPDTKLKFPKFKLPNFTGPKVKGPELDADLKAPGFDTNLDLPKVDAPNVDLKAPDRSWSTPKVEGGLDAPDLDINLSKADLKGLDVDVDAPDVDASGGKFQLPKIKMPNFGFSGPRVKGPDVDVDVKGPDLDLSLPDVNAKLPKGDLTAPDVDLKAPDLSWSAPKVEGGLDAPDLDINLSKADLKGLDVDVDAPDVDASGGKFQLPKIKMPNFGFSGPRVKGPNDVDLSLPDVDAKLPKGDLTAADLSLSVPNIEGDLSTPDLNLDVGLKKDIKLTAPKTNISLPDLNLSTPKIKSPDVDIILPKTDVKGSSLDLPKADLQLLDLQKVPKGELEAPDVTLKSPNVDLKGPDAQFKRPDLDLDSHLGDFKLPHFRLPNLNLSSPEVEVPSINPSVEAEIEAPGVNIGTATADANISVPAADLSAPKLEGAIKGPTVDVKAPNVDANVEKSRFPHFKLPKFSFSGAKIQPPEVDANANLEGGSDDDSETDVSNAEVEIPAFKFHRLPRNNVDGIGGITDSLGISKLETEAKDYVISKGIRLPIVNATSKAGDKINIMERLKMAKEKTLSVNTTPTEDIDLKLAAPSLDVSTSTEAGDSTLVRGGTFKVDKPESTLGLVAPQISTSDENDKLSLSLSNMLGLNIKDSDAE
ncbi:neuroblast differentiation-associated protein AHNAK [Brachyistius frenatus]|uniref:neuroblast differentiation-associated protein AHNAK n=1 Tax=Brachyistius frenatus TaxID=100188 RepID=UPI0037E99325